MTSLNWILLGTGFALGVVCTVAFLLAWGHDLAEKEMHDKWKVGDR